MDKSKFCGYPVGEQIADSLPTRTVQTEKLREFSDRNQFARKKTDPRSDLLFMSFRISAEAQSEIDKAIKVFWKTSRIR
ncbi:ParB family protein [Yersinia pestis]|uniref:ParB family protein n=1 Tax=Yersinia pestis TaxID=632 RepID=UPI0031343D51